MRNLSFFLSQAGFLLVCAPVLSPKIGLGWLGGLGFSQILLGIFAIAVAYLLLVGVGI